MYRITDLCYRHIPLTEIEQLDSPYQLGNHLLVINLHPVRQSHLIGNIERALDARLLFGFFRNFNRIARPNRKRAMQRETLDQSQTPSGPPSVNI